MRRSATIALLAAALCLSAGGAIGARTKSGTSTAVYTADQADAGARLYAQRCAMCHGRMLEGTYETPGLTGKFIANWSNRPLGDLFDYMGRAMPQFAPGTLRPEENAQIVAFLLRENGAPAGLKALPPDGTVLRGVRFDPMTPKSGR